MRTSLTVRETAFLLQVSEMKARRLVEKAELRLVGQASDLVGRRRIRIDFESVVERFPRNGSFELRRILMYAILAGRLTVPAPSSRWGRPAALVESMSTVAIYGDHSVATDEITSSLLRLSDPQNSRYNGAHLLQETTEMTPKNNTEQHRLTGSGYTV